MDFQDKFKNVTKVKFNNLPISHSFLNGQIVEIEGREFRGWGGWFYKVKGHLGWFQEGCFINA